MLCEMGIQHCYLDPESVTEAIKVQTLLGIPVHQVVFAQSD